MIEFQDKVTSIFDRNRDDIDAFNLGYEREIEAYINDDPLISAYEDVLGQKMKPHITILRGNTQDFSDLHDAFIVGGLNEGFTAYGLKNREEWVNRTVNNLAIISEPPAILRKLQHNTLGAQKCRVITFKGRTGKVECGVGAVFPVVLDGKPCYAAIGIQLYSTPWTIRKLSKDSIVELMFAMQMIKDFSQIITTRRFLQFGQRNLREFLIVDYPRKYLWNSQVFKLKNTFLEIQDTDGASGSDEDDSRSEIIIRSSESSQRGEQTQAGQAMQRTCAPEDEDYGSSDARRMHRRGDNGAQGISQVPRPRPPAHPTGCIRGNEQYQGGSGAQDISREPRHCPPAHHGGFAHGSQQYQRGKGTQAISQGTRHCPSAHPAGNIHGGEQYQGGSGAQVICREPRHCPFAHAAGYINGHGNPQYQRGKGAPAISQGPRHCLTAHAAGYIHWNQQYQGGKGARALSQGPRHCPPAHPTGYIHGDEQYQGGSGAQDFIREPRHCPPAYHGVFTHGNELCQRGRGSQAISQGPSPFPSAHPAGYIHGNQQYQGGKGAQAIIQGPRHCLPAHPAGFTHWNQQYQGSKGAQAISHGPCHFPSAHAAGYINGHGNQQYQGGKGAQAISQGPLYCPSAHAAGYIQGAHVPQFNQQYHRNQHYQGGKGAQAISLGPRQFPSAHPAGYIHGDRQCRRRLEPHHADVPSMNLRDSGLSQLHLIGPGSESAGASTTAHRSRIDARVRGQAADVPRPYCCRNDALTNHFFRVGDRVHIHLLRNMFWLNGVQVIVEKVLTEKRKDGEARVRAKILYDHPIPNILKDYYPHIIPAPCLRPGPAIP